MKNVILLTIDTLRRDVFGCYGNGEGFTPFIDSIQNRCIRFENAQSCGPYTQASFPGILASTHFLEYGLQKELDRKKVLVSEPLKRNGITTAAFHSNAYMCEYFGWNRGWDTFYDSMDEPDELITDHCPYIKGNLINDKVNTWLDSHIQEPEYNRFFLWAHYMDVHEPYVPDMKYLQRVDPSITISADEMFKLFTDVILPRDASDKDTVSLLRKLYQAHVLEVDEYARSFFEMLEKHGVLDDSIVIITSDHGDEFDDHGGLSHDGKMYGELTNVPLFIFDPSLDEGKVCNLEVSGADTPPTVLNLFGLENEPSYYGSSLLPLEEYGERGCFGECIGKLQHKMKPDDKPAHYLRENNLKLIHRQDNNSFELYDLEADPGETNNIVGSSKNTEKMKSRLVEFVHRNSQ